MLTRSGGALLENLHVTHGLKRTGVGSRLMAEVGAAVVSRRPGSGLHLWVLEQNLAAQAFYEARGGTRSDRRAVRSPGGVEGRLCGSPFSLRYVWLNPTVLFGTAKPSTQGPD